MRVTVATACLLSIAACASSGKGGGSDAIPTLQVTSPTRGTTSDSTQITVTGVATDDGPLKVTVNGTAVTLAKDGSFSATITVPEGLSLIETHAIDQGGHDVRDVRAVLAGALAPTDGSQSAPIAAHASPAALQGIANAMASAAEGIDFTSAAQAFNPVYNNTGCLGAVINITSVSIGSISASITPQQGALATNVDLNNVTVHLHADFKVACIGGSTNITVSASAAHISGLLGVSADRGTITTTLPSDSIVLDNFNLQVGGVPSQIVDLFNSHVQSAVESTLASVLKNQVPPLADQALAGLVAQPYDVSILGHDAFIDLVPSSVDISASGMTAAAQSTLYLADGTSGMFAPMPATLSSSLLDQDQGLGVAIADDLANQLLAGLWSAGAFDQSIPTGQIAILAALLDPNASTLAVKLALPPMITTTSDGKLQLALGDAMISVEDASGAQLQQIALSLTTDVSASPSQSGKILLAVGQPTVYADVVAQDPNSTKQLTDQQVEGIVTGVWGIVGQQADQALGNLPMPSIAGVNLGAPTIAGSDGFVTADIPVQ